MSTAVQRENIDLKNLGMAVVLNLIWVNLSEVFRYFAFVMPMMRDAMAMVPDVAPMNFPTFMIWGVWDTLVVLAITLGSWLVFERFGYSKRNALLAGTSIWAAIFVVLWLGLFNMNLAPVKIAVLALPLAWLEMVVAAFIARSRFV
jgi:hypothetical protein